MCKCEKLCKHIIICVLYCRAKDCTHITNDNTVLFLCFVYAYMIKIFYKIYMYSSFTCFTNMILFSLLKFPSSKRPKCIRLCVHKSYLLHGLIHYFVLCKCFVGLHKLLLGKMCVSNGITFFFGPSWLCRPLSLDFCAPFLYLYRSLLSKLMDI